MSATDVVADVAQTVMSPTAADAGGGTFASRLLRRPLAVICLTYLLLVVGTAVLAPMLLPDVAGEQAGDLLNIGRGPSLHHLLGTDSLGRDVLDRLLVGTRVTMVGVAEAVLVTMVLGVPLGLAAGYFGGRVDRGIGWLSDLSFSLPGIAIVLIVLSVFPHSMLAAMTTIGMLGAPYIMRIIRSSALVVREEPYVTAAHVSGLSHFHIVFRHILPRVWGPVIVLAALVAASALLTQSGLAYLGLIVRVPAPSWGGMIGDGIANIVLHPWLIWPPGLAMALTVVAFGLLSDAARDVSAEGWSVGPTRAPRRRRKSSQAEFRSWRRLGAEPAVVPATAHSPLLKIESVTVTLPARHKPITIVEDVSFDIHPGETVGLVGESGCGKTVTAMSILGLVPGGGTVSAGRITLDGREISGLGERELQRVRGKQIALISQESMASLNPVFRIGSQLEFAVRTHQAVSRKVARSRVLELLHQVQLPDPELVARRYPHELSGGMAQRVAIARALAGEPQLLIADEPTTALDVTIQAEILDLFRELQRTSRMAILLVTHDWGVVADLCDRVVVMYAGQVVERATLESIFREPRHPYTQALLASDVHKQVGKSLPTIRGGVPKPGAWPVGCHFHPRCAYATTVCRDENVPLVELPAERETRCLYHELLSSGRSRSGGRLESG